MYNQPMQTKQLPRLSPQPHQLSSKPLKTKQIWEKDSSYLELSPKVCKEVLTMMQGTFVMLEEGTKYGDSLQ
jgi:hypothetical protein